MHEQWGTELEVVIRVIQVSLAPAFLLAAIASLLTVLTGRLARAVDRSREVQAEIKCASEADLPLLHEELSTLVRRKRLVRRSMQLAVAAGVVICAVVALLFVMGLVQFSMASAIVVMFALAMALIAASLGTFLLETSLAAHEVALAPGIDPAGGEGDASSA